jgi:hypothetical protein
MLQMNKVTDGSIFNVSGQPIMTFERTSTVDISGLRAGMYFLKDAAGNVQTKLITASSPGAVFCITDLFQDH